MWDSDALKGLGLDEASKAHEALPASRETARTRPEPLRPAPAVATARAPQKRLATKKKTTGAASWAATIALAVAVGLGVYALVRYLLV